MRVTAVLNPIKPQAREARTELQTACSEADWPAPVIVETTIDRPGGPQAQEAVEDGAELVIAMGGDGTVREVAHGVAGTGVQFGVVPLGTANLFARNMGILPNRLGVTVRMALHGMLARVDLGLATFREFAGVGPWSGDLPFLVMAGIGQDARTVVETRDGLKGRLGWLAYMESGARHMLSSSIRMRVSTDDAAPEEITAWTVLAGNCGRIPAGIEVFPDAVVDDGQLDILQARIDSPLRWVGVAAQGLFKLRNNVSGLHYHPAAEVTVIPEVAVPIQLDGDAYLPVGEARFRVWPRALLLRLPPGRIRS
ncbi:diacylglycerol/lipid kinase family protein [Granulicoccus sp. GXG6511]|uniref:diacylglycerol/lipid kinase family protein n=1 Tax=Granulicoccus sp. GXG6511 TaxID=3381351 RepID=UPI003D7D0641